MTKIIMFLLAVLVFTFSGSISAQTIGEDNQVIRLKLENTALQYSLYGTLFPVGISLATKSGYELAIAGVMVGPSLGYFYGDEVNRGLRGIGIRTGLAAATLWWANEASRNSNEWFAGLSELITGTIIILIHDLYDIASVKGTIRKHNIELMHKSQTSVMILPKYFADSKAGGLELTINF